MENAVEALKIAFGVLAFVVALTVLFNISTLARTVASEVITDFDRTTYYTYIENDEELVDENGNRIVGIEDITPALYRYATESYGVTIIDNGEIVARFDLDTESLCSNWYVSTDLQKQAVLNEINDYVLRPVGAPVISNLETLYRKIYRQNTSANHPREFDCPWNGYDALTAQRVDSDLSRYNCVFQCTKSRCARIRKFRKPCSIYKFNRRI